MVRPLALLSASLLLLSAVGCENSNSLAAGGPCSSGEALRAAPTQVKPSARALWDRANGGHVYRPNEEGGMTATASAAVSVDALLEAMDVDLDLVESKSLTGNGKQAGIFTAMGEIGPTEGNTMGWLSTGVAGAGTDQSVDPSAYGTQEGTDFFSLCPGSDIFENPEWDCVSLSLAFEVPDNMHSVRFDFAFMSTEYPEFVNLGFNDEFTVSLHSPTNNYDNIVYDDNGSMVNIDSAFFDEPCPNLAGTGFDLDDGTGTCDAGGTGLLSTIAPVEPGETATLTFNLRDRGDGIYDSAIMIDNIAVRSQDVDEPETDPCS
jgi:hypothetical protein